MPSVKILFIRNGLGNEIHVIMYLVCSIHHHPLQSILFIANYNHHPQICKAVAIYDIIYDHILYIIIYHRIYIYTYIYISNIYICIIPRIIPSISIPGCWASVPGSSKRISSVSTPPSAPAVPALPGGWLCCCCNDAGTGKGGSNHHGPRK